MIPPHGGVRLPESTHVGPVILQVGDMARSHDYYEDVLGLLRVSVEGGTAAFGAADGRILVMLHERPGARPAPRRGAFGLYHFAILVPDRAALGRFATHLSRLNIHVGMADHFVSEALYLTDPDGLGIEVYADRPRSSWKSRGDELVMVSDPLDIRSVMEAGVQRVWDGMPAGTIMGHMHLHVGDLSAAEAFYHQALGLDKVVWSYPGALFLSAGGYHHHLGVNTWSAGPSANENEARLLEWQLVVPTSAVAAAVAGRVDAAGFQTDSADGAWVLTDPWGTRVRVIGE